MEKFKLEKFYFKFSFALHLGQEIVKGLFGFLIFNEVVHFGHLTVLGFAPEVLGDVF